MQCEVEKLRENTLTAFMPWDRSNTCRDDLRLQLQVVRQCLKALHRILYAYVSQSKVHKRRYGRSINSKQVCSYATHLKNMKCIVAHCEISEWLSTHPKYRTTKHLKGVKKSWGIVDKDCIHAEVCSECLSHWENAWFYTEEVVNKLWILLALLHLWDNARINKTWEPINCMHDSCIGFCVASMTWVIA